MKFLGMGDNVVDRYVHKKLMFPGGNGLNFAVFAKKLGYDSAYLGILADDKEGRHIRNSLLELGVDVSMSPLVKGAASERCDVAVVDGDRIFIGCSYGDGEHQSLKLTNENLHYMRNFSVIHCACYGDMEDEIYKLKELPGIKTFDFSEEEEYKKEEYLKKICPYIDLALFSGADIDLSETEDLKNKVIELGTKNVLITRGIKGQIFFHGGEKYIGEVEPVEPVDTMGAGDSFFTAFVITLANLGWNGSQKLEESIIKQALKKAAKFSALNCKHEGSYGFATPYGDD